MTTLTAIEGIPTITTEFPNWQPATWEDYPPFSGNDKRGYFKLL